MLEPQQCLRKVKVGSNREGQESCDQGSAMDSQLGIISGVRSSFSFRTDCELRGSAWDGRGGVPNTNITNPELESGSGRSKVRPCWKCMEARHTPPGCRNPSMWEERALCFCGDSWAVGGKLMDRCVQCPVVSEGLTAQPLAFYMEVICTMEGYIVLHVSPLLLTTLKPTRRKESLLISSIY